MASPAESSPIEIGPAESNTAETSPAETSPAKKGPAKKGRGRPPGISDRVRRDVYDAVRQILMTAGYGALRLDDVAAAAGVHKSTLYRQWTSKAQLVGDVLSDGAAEHYPRPDEGSWSADIDALCHDLVRLFRNPTTIAFVRTRAVADDPELSAGLRQLGTANFGFVGEPFKRAMARGEIDPTLSVDALAELVISPFLARAAVTRLPIDDAFGKSVAAALRAIGRAPSAVETAVKETGAVGE